VVVVGRRKDTGQGVYLERFSTMVWSREKGDEVSDNAVFDGEKKRTHPETLGISASRRIDGRAGLVDEDGGHNMNAADES